MMKHPFLLILVFIGAQSFAPVKRDRCNPQPVSAAGDIVVGKAMGDSAASVSIHLSEIQNSIVTAIDVLQNAVVSTAPPVISLRNTSSYLVFEATAVTSKKILIAVGRRPGTGPTNGYLRYQIL